MMAALNGDVMKILSEGPDGSTIGAKDHLLIIHFFCDSRLNEEKVCGILRNFEERLRFYAEGLQDLLGSTELIGTHPADLPIAAHERKHVFCRNSSNPTKFSMVPQTVVVHAANALKP